MRNLSSSRPGDLSSRSSSAGINQVANQAHAKYKVISSSLKRERITEYSQGLISTAGYCKFSAWKRETEIPKQSFSKLILTGLAAQNPSRSWLKDQTTGRSQTFGEGGRDVRRLVRSLAQLGVGEGSVVCFWSSNYVEYWLLSLAVWELGGVTLPTNCLTNTDRLQQQLKETSALVIVCDTYNVDQAITLKQEVSSLEHVLLIGQEEEMEGVVTVSSLLNNSPDINLKEVKLDWDKAPVCLMYTTRNGESKVVKHTNKSLTAQVFSPKGSSNNWFDQVRYLLSLTLTNSPCIRMSETVSCAAVGFSTSKVSSASPSAPCRDSPCSFSLSTVTPTWSPPWSTPRSPTRSSTPGR